MKALSITAVWRNGGFSASYDSFVVAVSAIFRLNICAKNPPLRQAAERYVPFKTTVMKTALILTILYSNVTYCFSQKQFTLNSSIGTTTVKINGIQYQADSIGVKIKTNYPKFDTLTFIENAPNINIPIICNFKPDSAYSISVACCGSLDIIPASKFKNDSLSIWDFEKDFNKIQNQLMDKPFISIRTKRNPKNSIYAWHADAACMTEHKLINSTLWRLGIPPKCFYWNNITTIQFFTTDEKMAKHEETDLEEFLQIKNIVELSSISFRLFDNEKFVITYDENKSSIKLEYE